jgi:glycosyltransferase involved in cell wall biosynthesis
VRVLAVFNKYPWPVNSGDAVRNAAVVTYLQRSGVEVHVAALPQSLQATPAPPPEGVHATTVGQPIGTYLGSALNRARTVGAGRPYQLSVGGDPQLRRELADVWNSTRFDAVLVASTYSFGALPEAALPRTVLDTHNVEYLRLGHVFGQGGRLLRLVGPRVIERARRYEAECLEKVCVTLACSAVDSDALRRIAPTADVRIVPNGVWTGAPPAIEDAAPEAPLLFLASLDYSANIDALRFFLEDVVPALDPDLPVAVAGSNARPEALELVAAAGPRVTFLGEVDDPVATRRTALALVVPLRQGSGTRLKILEAWSEGVPVISTAKGSEGLGGEPDMHLLQAETPAQFAAAATRLRSEPGLRGSLTRAGHDLVTREYSWQSLGGELRRALDDAAGQSTASERR